MTRGLFLLIALGLGLLGAGTAAAQSVPRIPVPFSLETPGYVTLVIEDEAGNRVRNLIQEAYFNAGEQQVYWDGYDEGVPVNRVRLEGTYDIERRLVQAGTYRVRGLFHEGINLEYGFSIQSPGTPPWHTSDNTGAWHSDHQSAWDVVHLPAGTTTVTDGPALLFVAKTGEAGHGILLLDEDGRKLFGVQSLPGSFLAGQAVARDAEPAADPRHMAYIGSMDGRSLSIYGYQKNGSGFDRMAVYDMPATVVDTLKGLVVHNQIAVATVPVENALVFLDLKRGTLIGKVAVQDPRGLSLGDDGLLYLASGRQVVRYRPDFAAGALNEPEVVVAKGLASPQNLLLHDGALYVSDWGDRHQVKVFDLEGDLLRTIGTPGGPQIGLYDETRMAFPRGLAVDTQGRLWVAERHYLPKRISRWDAASGAFDRAWYGPPRYGGGGMIDAADPTRFYYAHGRDEGIGVLAFEIDWAGGAAHVKRVLLDEKNYATGVVMSKQAPQYARRVGERQYLVNNNQNPGNGSMVVGAWLLEGDRLWPVVAAGIVSQWEPVWDLGEWQQLGVSSNRIFFVWSDLDRDGYPSPGEVQYIDQALNRGTFFIEEDLSISSIWGYRLSAPTINADGVPVYDRSSWHSIAPSWAGDDKDSYHLSRDSLFISLLGPVSFFNHGELIATYHSQWPNRNESESPVPTMQFPGQLLETTRPLGDFLSPPYGETGPVWGVSGEYGQAWLFTWDGLFITRLLNDSRTHPAWRYPAGTLERGDVVAGISPGVEHFGPTLNQGPGGELYYVAGKEHSSLLRLDGLQTTRRLDLGRIEVTDAHLRGAEESRVEAALQQEQQAMTVHLRSSAPNTDGLIEDWSGATWMEIDASLGIKAALAVYGDSLYLALQTEMEDLLQNQGQGGYPMDFSTGGGIDLWIGTDTSDRTRPAAGDRRVFITRTGGDPVQGALRVTLFEAVNPEAEEGVGQTYTSPIGETRIDRVEEITASVSFAQKAGAYELALPLDALGLKVEEAMVVRGDVGVLIGDGVAAQRRIYWNNKTATTVADLPGEAAFAPFFWGRWSFLSGGDPVVTGVDDAQPGRFELAANYPNPFNPVTTIRYRLPAGEEVRLEVFDLLGRRVALLVDGLKPAGSHEARWDARGQASGLYFYRLTAGAHRAVRTAVLAK